VYTEIVHVPRLLENQIKRIIHLKVDHYSCKEMLRVQTPITPTCMFCMINCDASPR